MPFDHFRLLAPFYEKVIRFQHLERILEIAGLPTTGMLLDAGGGTGRVAKAIQPYTAGVVVMDVSQGMLRQACQKNLPAVNGKSESIPFAGETFERVLMVDALHHVLNQAATVREMWRVLKPGGRLIIEEPDIHSFSVKIIALMEKLAWMRSHFLPAERIIALFAQSGAKLQILSDDHTLWVVAEK